MPSSPNRLGGNGMKAMILAAGRGERMRPLTDQTPKPLLKAANKPLIIHTIEKLAQAGFKDIVINIAYLGQQIQNTLKNGSSWGVSIEYSDEGNQALETAGGIINALPLLGDNPFLVINSDIAHDFDLLRLKEQTFDLAHLILMPNPEHHPEGDFHIAADQTLNAVDLPKYTYSGIGLFNPELFSNQPYGSQRLAPLLRQYMPQQRISGELFEGFWMDIGTPARLQELNDRLTTI